MVYVGLGIFVVSISFLLYRRFISRSICSVEAWNQQVKAKNATGVPAGDSDQGDNIESNDKTLPVEPKRKTDVVSQQTQKETLHEAIGYSAPSFAINVVNSNDANASDKPDVKPASSGDNGRSGERPKSVPRPNEHTSIPLMPPPPLSVQSSNRKSQADSNLMPPPLKSPPTRSLPTAFSTLRPPPSAASSLRAPPSLPGSSHFLTVPVDFNPLPFQAPFQESDPRPRPFPSRLGPLGQTPTHTNLPPRGHRPIELHPRPVEDAAIS